MLFISSFSLLNNLVIEMVSPFSICKAPSTRSNFANASLNSSIFFLISLSLHATHIHVLPFLPNRLRNRNHTISRFPFTYSSLVKLKIFTYTSHNYTTLIKSHIQYIVISSTIKTTFHYTKLRRSNFHPSHEQRLLKITYLSVIGTILIILQLIQ
jgi:hypothetical protein